MLCFQKQINSNLLMFNISMHIEKAQSKNNQQNRNNKKCFYINFILITHNMHIYNEYQYAKFIFYLSVRIDFERRMVILLT